MLIIIILWYCLDVKETWICREIWGHARLKWRKGVAKFPQQLHKLSYSLTQVATF